MDIFLANKRQIKKIVETKRFPLDVAFWFNFILGTILFGYIFFCATLLILKSIQLNFTLNQKVIFLILIYLMVLWKYWQNNKFLEIKKTTNIEIQDLIICFQKLGWEYHSFKGIFYITNSKPYLHFLQIIIISTKDSVLYNFQYSEHKGIRPPFFTGIRTYALKKFIKAITAKNQD